ncbi:MAG: outer membrane protein transport protein [Bacteroidetes bacterium]|nr:outer membrane protein transport protein [Bacteroidota bacterium]
MGRRSLALLLLFHLAYEARGGGYSLHEQSARAGGLAGAYTAHGRHVSTLYYNPAGLAWLTGWQFYMGTSALFSQGRFRGPLPYALAVYRTTSPALAWPTVFAAYGRGIVFGAGLHSPYGFAIRWPRDWPGRGIATDGALRTLFAQLAAAYSLPDLPVGRLSLGAGLMYGLAAQFRLERAVVDLLPEGALQIQADLDGPVWGWSAGLLYEPSPTLGVGLAYRSRMSAELAGPVSTQNLPGSAFPADNRARLRWRFPDSWSLGLRLSPREGLTLLADYVWWGWSYFDTLRVDFSKEGALLRDWALARLYRNSYQVRAGLEYEGPLPRLTLRLGLAFDKNPVPDETLDPTLPDADQWIFAGGLSYALSKQLSLETSYRFARFRERRNSAAQNGFWGIYNARGDLLSFGLSLSL